MRHVVLITIDTLRRDVLGTYGNPNGLTPFLDSLAANALVFTGAYSAAPYTQASFPGMLTSSYLFDTPPGPKLSERRTLVSQALKTEAGEREITTAAFHSNPYLSAYFGWNRGWDRFYDSMQEDVDDMSPYISGAVINQKVDAWLGSVDRQKPLFLWVHYMDVHEPYVPPPRYLKCVDASIDMSRERMFTLFKEVVLSRDASNAQTVELLRKLYQAHVCEVDAYVGRLFELLERHGVLRDATVILSTDHGDEFGEHGGLSHDGKMYEELVHVPQIIVNPPEGAASVCHTLVSGIDLPPTILHLFGLSPHPGFQGNSLFPLAGYAETAVYGEAIGKLAHKIKETDRPAYYCRRGRWKVIYRSEDDRWELYDLEADPRETNNRIEEAQQFEEMMLALKPRIEREQIQ